MVNNPPLSRTDTSKVLLGTEFIILGQLVDGRAKWTNGEAAGQETGSSANSVFGWAPPASQARWWTSPSLSSLTHRTQKYTFAPGKSEFSVIPTLPPIPKLKILNFLLDTEYILIIEKSWNCEIDKKYKIPLILPTQTQLLLTS